MYENILFYTRCIDIKCCPKCGRVEAMIGILTRATTNLRNIEREIISTELREN